MISPIGLFAFIGAINRDSTFAAVTEFLFGLCLGTEKPMAQRVGILDLEAVLTLLVETLGEFCQDVEPTTKLPDELFDGFGVF